MLQDKTLWSTEVGVPGSTLTNAQCNYLDALRGGAAQLVLIGHIYSISHPGKTWGIGDLGVIVFFILSGFLISYSALVKLNKNGYSFQYFLRDRFFRIFVPYLPALLLVVGIDTLVYRYTNATTYLEYYSLKDFVATLLMLQQHPVGLFADQLLGLEELKLSTFSSSRPWWTVANEWWLYLTFGLLLFSRELSSRSFPLFIALLAAISLVPLFNSVAGTGQGLSLIWFLMAFFAWGYLSWSSTLQKRLTESLRCGSRLKWILLASGGLLLGLSIARVVWISFIDNNFHFVRPNFFDFNLYVLLAAFFIMTMILLGNKKIGRRQAILRFIAEYSYSLYLTHYTLISALYAFKLLDADSPMSLIFAYALSNLLAITLYFLFERHYKRLQTYYESRFTTRGDVSKGTEQ